MVKYKYSIVCEERIEEIKQTHFLTIEATSFNSCIQKFNKYYPSWEIIKIERL